MPIQEANLSETSGWHVTQSQIAYLCKGETTKTPGESNLFIMKVDGGRQGRHLLTRSVYLLWIQQANEIFGRKEDRTRFRSASILRVYASTCSCSFAISCCTAAALLMPPTSAWLSKSISWRMYCRRTFERTFETLAQVSVEATFGPSHKRQGEEKTFTLLLTAAK